jgi:hypothetical protein
MFHRMEVAMFVRGGFMSTFVLILLTGCGEVSDPSAGVFYTDDAKSNQVEADSFALVNGTPDAVGVLAFVNDEATDLHRLDVEAKLDRRAARGIIHHRNGPDGVYGTWDDESFETIEALDAVKWVGGRAIGRLVDYSNTYGWVPSITDHLGNYDGVDFTVLEADITLALINESSLEALDEFLNRRAAVSLFDNGPFASIYEVAQARYVGRSAMKSLKRTAVQAVQIQK